MNIDEVKIINATPVPDRVKSLLAKLAYKEVLTTAELADKLEISYGRFKSTYTTAPSLSEYRLKVRIDNKSNQTVWGSTKTINELKRRINQ